MSMNNKRSSAEAAAALFADAKNFLVISKRQFCTTKMESTKMITSQIINQNKLLTISQHCSILATSLTNGFLKFLTRFSGKSRACLEAISFILNRNIMSQTVISWISLQQVSEVV